MTDSLRLDNKLNKLKAPPSGLPGGLRLVPGRDGHAKIGAMLTEMDETILPRSLKFQTQSGRTLEIEVSNRRILRVSRIEPPDAAASQSALLNASLSDGENHPINELAALFAWFVEEPGKVFVSSSKMARNTDPTEIGLPVTAVAATLDLDLYEQPAPDTESPLEQFLSEIESPDLSWIILAGGEVTSQGGNSAMIDRLAALSGQQLADLESQQRALTGAATGSFLSVVGTMSDVDAYVALARTPEATALMVFLPHQLAHAVAAWQRLNPDT